MKGKAKFKSPEKLQEYISYYRNNYKNMRELIQEVFDRTNIYKEDNKLFSLLHKKFISPYLDSPCKGYSSTTDNFPKDITYVNDYITSMGGCFEIYTELEDITFISYGKYFFGIFNSDEYIVKEYPENIEALTLSEYKRISLLGDVDSPMALIVPGEEMSLKSVKDEKFTAQSEINKIRGRIDDISKGVSPEFNELQAQIKALQDEMEKKKQSLLAEIQEKKAIMEAKMAELQKQLTILQDSIYTIQCYLGETIELFQIRSGKQSEIERPVIINQRLKYLDEDLAQLFSIYADDIDGGGFKIIEELLKYSDVAFDFFCPYDKCISFFKISKDGKNYGNGDEEQANMLKAYDFLHGNKVGFAVRDGENLFIGYTDEDRIYVNKDVFLKPEVKHSAVNDEDAKHIHQSSYEEFASRMFIFSILQGLLERKEVIQLPEKVNVFSSFVNSKYVVWNYAEGWLKDNRFGSFANLMRKLNKVNTVGDDILLILHLSETSWKKYESNRGRADAYVNRTHDCRVKEGLNKINFIDDSDNLYVSAKKENSDAGATSNFLIERTEFINLTYINSEWLKYFLINKEIGDFRNMNYSYLAKFFKIALQFIQKREAEERDLIMQYYPNLDKVSEWVVALSHWKILNKVRKITDYQAKRFAKFLDNGKLKFVTNLFNGEYVNRQIKELKDVKFTEVDMLIDVRFFERKYICDKTSEDDVNKILADNRSSVHNAYEAVRQEVTNHSVNYPTIKKYFDKLYKSYDYCNFELLINEDLSYKKYQQSMFETGNWKCTHSKFKGKEKLYEVIWSNTILDLYKSIFNIIEVINGEKYEKAETSSPIKYI
jgi:Zn-ribbon protein, possibly nucleic acid-binding